MPSHDADARSTRHRWRKFLAPLVIGPAIAVGGVAASAGSASAQCSVSDGLLSQTASSIRSDSVRCLQQSLRERGVDAGPVDGWFGPVTKSAVTHFQQANGLTVDGWMGRETRTALGITRSGSARSTHSTRSTRTHTQRRTHTHRTRTQRQVSTGGGSTCDSIHSALLAGGASSGVANELAYHIARRESGCSPQFVHDNDDWSYSRFGLNAGAHGENVSAWRRLCGADVRSDTRNLSVDVRCALAAHAAMGWRPWAYAG